MSKSYDLSTSSKWSALSDGEHTVQIVAKGSGYRDSAKSTSVTVTKGGATLISFTIAGTSYQAEEGMTWAQWVNSSYNTATPKYYINDYGYVVRGSGGGGGARVTTDSGLNNSVSSTDIITATVYYYGQAN